MRIEREIRKHGEEGKERRKGEGIMHGEEGKEECEDKI